MPARINFALSPYFRTQPIGWLLAGLLLAATMAGCSGTTSQPAAPAVDAASLPGDEQLRDRIDEVLLYTARQRKLSAQRNAAWQIMHGVLAFGRHFPIDNEGTQVEAMAWVTAGNPMTGWTMRKGEQGLKAVVEPGTTTGQGHEDQWLAILAQCGYSSQDPLIVNGQQYVVGDLVKQAMYDMWDDKEASWTLVGLATFLPLDTQWVARDGGTWTLERIIGMEAAQDINSSACGGSHRLMGMTNALKRYRRQNAGVELTGGWKAAEERIRWGIETARSFQNPSGAFSARYFQRPSDSQDPTAHLATTGHTLEFLTLALNDEQLKEPWVTKAVVFLCDLFEKTKDFDLECGALYHAAHALVLYRERRFGPREYLENVPQSDSPPAATAEPTAAAEDEPEPASAAEPAAGGADDAATTGG